MLEAVQAPIAGFEYSGSGKISYTVFDPATQDAFDRFPFSFQFDVHDASWKIKVVRLQTNDFSDLTVTFDGTNIVFRYNIRPKVFLTTNSREKLMTTTNQLIEIHPSAVPKASFEPIVPIWLAYCSGQYFRSHQSVPPIWDQNVPAIFDSSLAMRTEISFLNEDPPLLGLGRFFSDGTAYVIDSATATPTAFMKYKAPWDKGFLAAEYSVTTTQQVNGVLLPHSFTFRAMRPGNTHSLSNTLAIGYEYKGDLDHVSFGNATLGLAEGMKPRATVFDFRTMKLDPPVQSVIYVAPSDKIEPMQPGSLPYTAYVQGLTAQPVGAPKIRVGFLVFMILITSVALLASFHSLRRAKGIALRSQENPDQLPN